MKTPHPKPEYQLRGVGPVRAGQRKAYGSVAPLVREALDRDGVVEAHALAAEIRVDAESVSQALKYAHGAGKVEKLFRGVYATPEVASAVREAIAKAVAS